MDMQIKQPVHILGVPIHPYTMDEAVALLQKNTRSGNRTFVVTANAEIIMMGQNDPEYLKILQERAQLVLPDGAGTVWGGNTLGYHIPERVAGYDLYLRLLAAAAQDGTKVFFFGGKPGVADAAAEEGKRRFPGLQVAGTRNGYFKPQDEPGIIKAINDSGAQVLFAALGAPKQEKWLDRYYDVLKPALLMGIGGSFDVLAGKVQRAPKWMQDAKLEWFYRLAKQPSRAGRMMVLPQYVVKILQAKKRNN